PARPRRLPRAHQMRDVRRLQAGSRAEQPRLRLVRPLQRPPQVRSASQEIPTPPTCGLRRRTTMSLPYIVIDGRAVADAELKFTQSGRAFAKYRIAANDSKKDESGNWETTETLFVNVTAWDDAERIATEVTR